MDEESDQGNLYEKCNNSFHFIYSIIYFSFLHLDVDSESESLDAEKKTRGPTFMKEIWGRPSTLPRIKIRCDDMGRPIGSRRNKFTDFLGTLARNGKFCPIDVEDWHKMPLDSKKKMLDVIKVIEMLLNNFIIK